jgi:putative colanic acid biosynthesis UDP-glucose lipid carrier transferase
MKKLLNISGNKISITSLHAYKFPEEVKYSIDKNTFLADKNLGRIINYNSFPKRDLYIQPYGSRFNHILKRSVDIFFSVIIIVFILSWLIPVIAILIKSDSRGPVFFLQKRNKKNGKVFTCLKFRSMIVNEEADILQAKENDLRITRVGKFLRKNHLDELPQFINVLLGDMSVVGPRPHMISDNLRYDECVDHYANRLSVKPGITGLAQVMGCTGPVEDIAEMRKRVRIDNFYIRHWSLKLDMIILYTTVFKAIH